MPSPRTQSRRDCFPSRFSRNSRRARRILSRAAKRNGQSRPDALEERRAAQQMRPASALLDGRGGDSRHSAHLQDRRARPASCGQIANGPGGDRTGWRRSGALAATALDRSHRPQFVFGKFGIVVFHSRCPLARSRSILSLPCAYWVSVVPAAFAISCSSALLRASCRVCARPVRGAHDARRATS